MSGYYYGPALATELDYRREAEHIELFAAAAHVAGDRVVVPEVVLELSGERVLVMERIAGDRLSDTVERLTAAGELAARDAICAAIVGSVARQVFVHGIVHGDPHPGNFLVTPANQVAVLDFGCVLKLTAAERAAWARLFAALIARDEVKAAHELSSIGFEAPAEADLLGMAATIVDSMRPGQDVATVDFNAQLAELTEKLGAVGRAGAGTIKVPPSFVLLSRVLGTLAGLLVRYQPRLEPFALLAPFVMQAQRAA